MKIKTRCYIVSSMTICISHTTALAFYRSCGRLLPQVRSLSRTGALRHCSVVPFCHVQDELAKLGVSGQPCHVLVAAAADKHTVQGFTVHVCSTKLPRNALIKISKSVWVVSSELLVCQLAAMGDWSDEELIRVVYELCGTYVIDASWDGLTNTDSPLSSTRKIGRFIESASPMHGVKRARKLLGFVHDRSNSPMETVLAMILTLPASHGGLGYKGLVMNYPLRTSAGRRFVDLAFPAIGVGLEYKGRAYHSVEAAGRDDRRQNAIVGQGMTVLNVWYEDVAAPHLRQRLFEDLARIAHRRCWPRSRGIASANRLLVDGLLAGTPNYRPSKIDNVPDGMMEGSKRRAYGVSIS